MQIDKKHVLTIQYAGDYRETVERFSRGGEETYYAQRSSVENFAEIGKRLDKLSTIICLTDEYYDEVLQNGVHAIGAGFTERIPIQKLLTLIAQQQPTHLIVNTPIRAVFRWAIRNKIPTIAGLADSFSTKGFRNKFRNFQLARLLNHQQIEWVFNHNINASRSLQEIGVNPDKIVPWDHPAMVRPDSFSPKTLVMKDGTWSLFYAGRITETKGVGDLLKAVSQLNTKNIPVKVKLAGGGETNWLTQQIKLLGIEEVVEVLGLVPNNKVVSLMREADIVVIPSRHEYPEGLPMTIYEALCSRTPIVASDHPMFRGKLDEGIGAVIFPASNSMALANSIEKLLSSPNLYSQLSENSAAVWEKLQIPVKAKDIMEHWLFDPPSDPHWFYQYRLSSGRYN